MQNAALIANALVAVINTLHQHGQHLNEVTSFDSEESEMNARISSENEMVISRLESVRHRLLNDEQAYFDHFERSWMSRAVDDKIRALETSLVYFCQMPASTEVVQAFQRQIRELNYAAASIHRQ